MARQARVRSKTDIYHIIMRGNNKTSIFERSDSKAFFMKVLLKIESEEDMDLIAWCIMDNHVHLVIKVDFSIFDHVFKRLNVRYAAFYHRQNQSVGHVFQGRVKSLPLENDQSLVNNVRYVHNNPVKAKMVNSLDDYKWSSYGAYITGTRNESMNMVKDIIGNTSSIFREFHQIEDNYSYLEIHEDLEVTSLERAQEIIQKKCQLYGVDSKEIVNNNEILSHIISTLIDESGLSGRKIAKMIGVSESRFRRLKKK